MSTRTPDWMDRALCAETDPESFFPDRGGSTKVAKAMCARCDVTAECLEFAITSEITYGVWGGQPERTIRKLRSRAACPQARRHHRLPRRGQPLPRGRRVWGLQPHRRLSAARETRARP